MRSVGGGGGGRVCVCICDITKQRHESLKSVLSVRSQGHGNLRERLTSLGPGTGFKAHGGRSDGVGTGQDGKSEAEERELSGWLQFHLHQSGLDIGLIMAALISTSGAALF